MKNTKTKLISSVAVLLICFAMLIGSTFAWFTDSASTGVNKIQAGNLDVVLSVKDKTGSGPQWSEVNENTKLFQIADNDKWEPGVMTYETLKVENVGNLAFDYTLSFLPTNVTDFEGKTLLDVIKVYAGTTSEINTSDRASVLNSISSMPSVQINQYSFTGEGMSSNESKEIVIVLYWQPTDSDNSYNLSGTQLKADLGIELVAKQANVESDSFGNDYDTSAMYPIEASVNIGTSINESDNTTTAKLVAETALKDANSNPVAKVTIPSGAVVNGGATKLTLSVDETSTPTGVVISSTSNSKTLEIKVDGLSTDNNTLLKVETNIGAGLGDITLRHITGSTETSMTKKATLGSVENNQDYYYDNSTGMLTFLSSSFSPFVIEYPKELWSEHTATQALEPNEKGVYEISTAKELALFAKEVNNGEETFINASVSLTNNIDLGEYLWVPIGPNADASNKFKGIFDGQGYTISNLYVKQGADYHAAGLFGALNGTVQNLIVDGAIIENLSAPNNVGYTDNGTGVITGSIYTNGLVENVTVRNATVDSNRYIGGIAGFAYGSVDNCRVENTTLTAKQDNLFNGEYDNGDKVGGIVGYQGESNYYITNCTASGVTLTAYRDVGGIAGVLNPQTIFSNNKVENTDIYYEATKDYEVYGQFVSQRKPYNVDNTNSFNNVTITQLGN